MNVLWDRLVIQRHRVAVEGLQFLVDPIDAAVLSHDDQFCNVFIDPTLRVFIPPRQMTRATGVEAGGGYNGWPNYESWAVALWLDNDEASFRYWRAIAREMKAFASDSRYLWDEGMSFEDAAKFELADRLRVGVEDKCPEIGPTMYADLLRAALAEVDWLLVAEHILEEMK